MYLHVLTKSPVQISAGRLTILTCFSWFFSNSPCKQ